MRGDSKNNTKEASPKSAIIAVRFRFGIIARICRCTISVTGNRVSAPGQDTAGIRIIGNNTSQHIRQRRIHLPQRSKI